MPRHLILRLEGPLMAFGGEMIDNHGVVARFPAASMVTGLIANALGWRREETARLDRLQDRLVFAARRDRDGQPMRDFQTAALAKDDRGWTTRGRPEGRAGGEETYRSPHLRYRDYDADACVAVALRLDPATETPTLDDVAAALERPARPLFLGRKPCLPSAPILAGEIEATDSLAALRDHPWLTEVAGDADVLWPEGDGDPGDGPYRTYAVTDRRNWRAGPHGGARRVCEGRLSPSARTDIP